MVFSVIIPVYKVEKYLQKCIDSVLRQTFSDYEVVLVDDGSPDDSGIICDENAARDSRIKVIRKKNGGQASARNAGVSAAVGDYVIFLDSDDMIQSSDFFQKLHDQFTSCPELDIVAYHYCKYYDDTGKRGPAVCGCRNPPASSELPAVLKYLISRDGFFCSAWSKAIRRNLLAANRIVFSPDLNCEDMDWYYQVLQKARRMAVLDESFILYRQRSGSVTSIAGEKSLRDYLFTLDKWSRILGGFLPGTKEEAMYAALAKLYCNLLIGYSRSSAEWALRYRDEIKALAPLLRLTWNPRARKMAWVYRAVGFRGVVGILKVLNRCRH